MRFLCDVHIPIRLVKQLLAEGHEALHVNRLPDGWRTSDGEICRYADQHDCVVVSKDADFRNSHLLRGTPRKLIRIVLGNLDNDALIQLFTTHLNIFEARFSSGTGFFDLSADRLVFHGASSPP